MANRSYYLIELKVTFRVSDIQKSKEPFIKITILFRKSFTARRHETPDF